MHLSIGVLDAAILLGYMAGITLLGIWWGRGHRNLNAYLLGGRDMPWWAVLLSIVATETSTVTFLSVPGLAFHPETGNMTFLQLPLGYLLGRLAVVWLLLPHYFRGEIFTAYEVLEKRFGGLTKRAASLLFMVTRSLADGLRLYLASVVLQYVLGVPIEAAIVLLGVFTVLYTWAGGLRSVVWNDCILFFVYILAAAVTVAVILGKLPGGWAELTAFAQQQGKFQVFDFAFDLSQPFTLWAGIAGGMCLTLATHGTDQMMVQRYLAARNERQAGWALSLSGLVVFAQFALFLLIGVCLACFYQLHPPQESLRDDAAYGFFILHELPAGITGLTLAGVFAAAMSVLSGSLNSSATAAVNDWYLWLRRQRPSEAHLLRVSRLLTVAFGIIQIGVAIVGQYLTRSVVNSVLAIAGFVSGGVLGVFFLGIATRSANQYGALLGLVTGQAVLGILAAKTNLAWPWYSLVGSSTTFVVGWLASRLLFAAQSPLAEQTAQPRVSQQE